MIVQTQFNYEKTWTDTNEADLLRLIKDEVGDADPKGVLEYITEAIKKGKVISVANCKFRAKESL